MTHQEEVLKVLRNPRPPLGSVDVDQYGDHGEGFGLVYEGINPPGAHLVGIAMNAKWLHTHAFEPPMSGAFTARRQFNAVLWWLREFARHPPKSKKEFTILDPKGVLSAGPPGHGAPGDWVWRGASWTVPSPFFGGVAAINLTEAVPPHDPWSLSLLLAQWRSFLTILMLEPPI